MTGRLSSPGSLGWAAPGNGDFTLGAVPDGSLDTGFNGTGEVITTGLGPLGAAARGVAVQTDDRIVAAGVSHDNFSGAIALVRYNTDGSLDTSFNGTGKVGTSVGSYSAAYATALQSDGKIVIAGYTYNSGATSFVLARYNSGSEPPPLNLTNALSRRVHGAAGIFDVNLPLAGDPGVECRSTRGRYTLVFTFSNGVVAGTASVTSGTATIAGHPIFSGNTITVNLTRVADLQTLTITLTGVTDAFAQVLPDTMVSVKMLIGDTNGDKTVNGSDVSQTRGQVGMPVTITNFREDVQVNGAINNADVKLVKSHRGATLP